MKEQTPALPVKSAPAPTQSYMPQSAPSISQDSYSYNASTAPPPASMYGQMDQGNFMGAAPTAPIPAPMNNYNPYSMAPPQFSAAPPPPAMLPPQPFYSVPPVPIYGSEQDGQQTKRQKVDNTGNIIFTLASSH